MAVTVGFISEKGGVGKTTACYHVAIGLARYHEKRVLVVDADYQRGGLSGRLVPGIIEHFGRGVAPGTTLFHKFQQLYSASPQTPDVDIIDTEDGIDLVCADPRLSTVSADKLPSTNNIRANNVALLTHVRTIRFVLDSVGRSYDYVLIDSHPEVSDTLRAIIYASDYCVSPVKLDRQSSIGVATILGEIANVNSDIEMIRSALGIEDNYHDTIFAGSIGMMAREYGETLKQTELLEFNRLNRAGQMFRTYVTEGDGLRQAAAARRPVYDITGANANKQAAQFRALTTEFMRTCHG